MKMPMEWHKKCHANMLNSLRRDTEALELMSEHLAQTRARVDLHQRQIDEAERQGKDGFDEYRFLVPRKVTP